VTAQTKTLQVLCVDDDLHVLSFVTDTLKAEGFEVQTAVDGQHALQKIALRDRPYDLLIVDARMPHLDGFRFVMQARAGGFKGKIIVFSGHLDEHERQRFRNSEIDRIIVKPPKSGELMRAIRELTAQAA
jgi:DNA-binding response OmpR family regulator